MNAPNIHRLKSQFPDDAMNQSPILDKIEVPHKVVDSWQETIDLLAEIADIPAARIMRVHAMKIEVFTSSQSAGNVYHRGEKMPLGTGLYCETVMSTQSELLVPNALSDPAWDHNPDIELGMISYLGLPLIWPTGEIFGTICILDNQENAYSQRIVHLMERMRDSISFSLQVIYDGSAVCELERRVQERTHELWESESLLTQAQSVAKFGVYSLDFSTGLWKSSAVMDQLFGIGEAYERSVEGWANLIHPDDRAMMADYFTNYVIGLRQPFAKEYRILRQDDQAERWVHGMGMLEIDDANRLTKMIGTIQDITERKRLEASLLNLEAAVEQSANTIVITDMCGNIEYANPAFEKTTGYTVAEAMGKNPRILKSGEQDAEFYHDLWATITSEKVWQGEFHNKRKDGSLYWERATISPIQNGKGETVRLLAIKEDITKRKAIEASLAAALLCAEAANRAKSEFLGVMSHELRTPLNGVLGFTELLADSALDSEQMDYVKIISSSGEHLLAIVSDILDFVSIEAGTLAIHVAPLAVADLVKTAENTVRKAAAEKGVELRCELAADAPESITGDELRMRQILINLLGNAVKFTARGSVVLHVATGSDGGGYLDFSVEDTGIGISSEDLSRLFQPFVQADSKGSRRFGGTGLGLAISKRIAEAMGGAITAASTPGKGSLFTFRFPLESAAHRARENASALSHISDRKRNHSELIEPCPPIQTGKSLPPSDKGLVLVVDDNRVGRMIAGKMIERLGYRVEFAASGEKAVEVFVPGKFSAILMDIAMPMMGGLEATGKIREVEASADGHVSIIAFTANVLPGERERCLAAGMDEFLSKPLRLDDLAAKLANRYGRR